MEEIVLFMDGAIVTYNNFVKMMIAYLNVSLTCTTNMLVLNDMT